MKTIFNLLVAILLFASCSTHKKIDTLIYNATIYTTDSTFTIAEAMAIDDGKIIAVGKKDSLLKLYSYTNEIDAKGKTILPGLIDAHCHFLGYGLQLNTVNLVDTKSWDEVLQRLKDFVQLHKPKEGEWITGRGWDQNDWPTKDFPTNEALSLLYPNNPILLSRIDGHAAIANTKALTLANVKPLQTLVGGTVVTKNNQLTGLLIDNAVDLVQTVIPQATTQQKEKALQDAQQNCFAVGLTTVDDCGINYDDIELIDAMHKKNTLQMKVYAMLSDNKKNYDYLLKKGKIQTNQLTVNGFKVYGDGALGSRGACLLNPYHDKPNEMGFLLSNESYFDSIAAVIVKHKLQMCTHAIGDSANRVLLKIYGKYLPQDNDLRWRIEHAQVVDANDFAYFGKYNIIPSVQPTHATSDMYWAEARLGKARIKNAYAYKQLLQQNGWMPLGTDFPVEDISPFKTFFAAVVRKDANNFPANGFQMENAITREQALRGMTIWAAKSNFEEKLKGSLEVGKYADFIIIDNDIMRCDAPAILTTKVLSTWINGSKVYGN